jgi:hypothetical protein
MAAITIPTTIFLSNKLKSVARIAGLGEVGNLLVSREESQFDPINWNAELTGVRV